MSQLAVLPLAAREGVPPGAFVFHCDEALFREWRMLVGQVELASVWVQNSESLLTAQDILDFEARIAQLRADLALLGDKCAARMRACQGGAP